LLIELNGPFLWAGSDCAQCHGAIYKNPDERKNYLVCAYLSSVGNHVLCKSI